MIDVPAVNGRDDAMGIDIQIYTPVVEMAFGKRLEVAVSQHAFLWWFSASGQRDHNHHGRHAENTNQQ